MTPEEINKVLVIPEEDKASPVKTSEAEFIYSFLLEKGIKSTLEVGFAYAKSASHIMAATQAPHITMDPFQKNYKYLGVENIKSLGLGDLLTYHDDYSHNVLPQLLKEGKKFDFIFIDGDHKFDGEFIDFYYADLLLNEGGYVLMHDTWMRSTRLVMTFINANRKEYKYIKTPLRNFALYQKTGKDERNGMHFKEFYSTKSILSHNLILWMTDGKSSFLKKMLFWLKDKVK